MVEWLYVRSKRFAKLEAIPETVRYKLADMALKRGELHFAARLLKGLDQPPEGEDPDQWSLRRARIMVYAGDFKGAALVLSNILSSKRALGPKFADRYLQVVFDLQAVGKHAEAYVLLDVITSYSIHYTKLYEVRRKQTTTTMAIAALGAVAMRAHFT